MTNRSQLTDRQRHLPDVGLVATGGASEPLLRHGRSLLLIALHDASCLACLQFMQSIAEVNGELNSWDMDVAVVAPAAVASRIAFRFFVDAQIRFADAMGITLPAVMVVDQWGDVKELHEAGRAHNFPKTDALVSWARYLATQCPECEGESL